MKSTLSLLTLAFVIPEIAQASIPRFNSITCRKFDYYQLAGDRKVFEVSIRRGDSALYQLQISKLFEVRQSDGSFIVRDRANAINPIQDMHCTQADVAIDEKVITCRKDSKGMDYISIARNDRTSIMSAMASVPGKIIHYSSYEIELLPANGKDEIYGQFGLKDCVIDQRF